MNRSKSYFQFHQLKFIFDEIYISQHGRSLDAFSNLYLDMFIEFLPCLIARIWNIME